MVAIVSGNALGLSLGSLSNLGQTGLFGSAGSERNGGAVYVNAATGNLVVQNQDDRLVGRGLTMTSVRTYNSQGLLTDDNGDNWSLGFFSNQLKLTGTRNTAGSTLTRTDRDGAQAIYTYDTASGKYVNTDGAGAYDSIVYDSASTQYVWADGASGLKECYESTSTGRLLSTVDTSGNTLTYTYSGTTSRVTGAADANGETTYFDYSGNNLTQIRTVITNGGSPQTITRVRYAYDGNNRLSTVTVDLTPNDNSVTDDVTYRTTYTYDGSSERIASITQRAGYGTADVSSLGFTYVQVGGAYRIATVTDGLNQVTTLSYDTANRRTTITDPLSRATTLEYDIKGQLIKMTAPPVAGVSQVVSYSYNTNGDLTQVVDGENHAVEMQYDANGNQALQRDAAGNTVARTYDARNQLLTESAYGIPDPDGAGSEQADEAITARYVYDAAGQNRLRFALSAEGRVSEYRYNAYGQRTASIRYAGAAYAVDALAQTGVPTEAQMSAWAAAQNRVLTERTDLVYDTRGLLQRSTVYASVDSSGVGVIDGTESVTQFVYDQAGLLLQTIDPRLGAATYAYDGLGRMTASIDATNQSTLTVYDDLNNKITITQPNGLKTISTYDKNGQLVSVLQASVSNPNLGETRYFYDTDGRLRMTQDPTGARAWMLYDEAGRKVADIDGTGSLTEYVYNNDNLLCQTIEYDVAVDVAALVDGLGNPTSVALASVRPTPSSDTVKAWRIYDAADRLIKTVDGGGAVIEYFYDGASRVIRTRQYSNTISIDGLGAMPTAAEASPDAGNNDVVTRSFYTDDGVLAAVLDPAGYLTEYRYDSAGRRVLSIAYAAITNDGERATGSLAALTPEPGSDDVVTRTLYNAKGQIVGDVDAEGYLTEHVYDANGNEVRTVRYATAVAWAAGVTLSSLRPAANAEDQVASATYTLLNQLDTETNAEGTITKRVYDNVGRLVATTKAQGQPDARTLTARYDIQGRLVGELSGKGSALLDGNQTQAQIDAIWAQYGTSHTYDAAGRRTSSTDAAGNKTLYFYDADNHLAFTINALGEVKEQRYNARNQLVSLTEYSQRISIAGLQGGLVTTALTNAIDAIVNEISDSTTRYAYASWGSRTIVTDAEGHNSYTSYDAFRLVSDTLAWDDVREQRVQWHTVSRDKRGQISDVFSISPNVGLSSVGSQHNVYDAFGRLDTATDANGGLTDFTYDRLGRVIHTVDATNANRSTTYDAFGRVLTQTDALDKTTTYAYDTANRSVTVTTPEGVGVTTVHNRFGQVQSITDGEAHTTSYEYDLDGNLVRTINPLTTSSSRYDGADRLIETTDEGGTLVVYKYDAANRILNRVVDPGGTGLNLTTSYAYDAKGQVVTTTDPNQVVTAIEYDRSGHVLKRIVDPTGLHLETIYTYDATGAVLTVTDPTGRLVQYTYDEYGRRIEEQVDPNGLNLTTRYAYDNKNNVIARTEAGNRVTRYAYDGQDRLVLAIDAAGGATFNEYDAEGRLVRTTRYATPVAAATLAALPVEGPISIDLVVKNAAKDIVEARRYDRDGRLRYTVDGTGAVVEYRHDDNGNVTERIAYANRIDIAAWLLTSDPAVTADAARDQRSRTLFDALNRPIFEADALGTVTGQVYDNNGNVLTRTVFATPVTVAASPSSVVASANDRTTRCVYDKAGRQIYSVDAEGGLTGYAYDKAGRVQARTDYARELDLSSLSVPAAAADITSRLVATAGGDRLTRTFYDAAGRERFQIDALGYATETVYLTDRTRTNRYAAAPTIAANATTADVAAALGSIANAAKDLTSEQRYDAAGRASDFVDAAGVITRKEYDGAGNVLRLTVALGLPEQTVTTYTYDAAGHLLSKTIAFGTAAAATTSYRYDALGQQVAEIEARGNALANDNSAWAQAERVRLGFASDATALSGSQKQALLDRFTTTNAYDAAGRLVSTTSALGATTTTSYDALGNATVVVDPRGNTGYFYFDLLGRVTLQVDPEGYATETIYAPALADKVQSVRRYATKVAGGSTRPALTTSAQDAVTTYQYDKLGRVLTTVDAGAATESVVYDVAGNRFNKTVTNKVGGTATYLYDQLGQQISETLPVQSKNAGGALTSVVNVYVYDAFGNRTQTIEAQGLPEQRVTGYRYDKLGRVTHRIGAAYTALDSASLVTSTVTPIEFTRYDALGRVIESLGGGNWTGSAVTNGQSSFTYYDAAGNVTATVAADGALVASSYAPNGLSWRETAYATRVALPASAGGTPPAATADPANDRTTIRLYDAVGRLVEAQREAVVYWEQGNNGDAITINLPQPQTVTLEKRVYDAAGNVTQLVDARGNSVFTYYDTIGRRVLAIDQEGYATAWDYADLFDAATQQTRYGTRLVAGQFARQDDTSAAAALRDPAALRQGLANGSLRPTDGANGVRLSYAAGTNSDIHRNLGNFAAGDTVTFTVWFKADPKTTGMIFLGDVAGPDPLDNTAQTIEYGDGGWRKLTATVTLTHADELWAFLYADRDGAYHKAGSSVLYDKIDIRSTQRGVVLSEGFESGLSNWLDGGAAPKLEAIANDADRVSATSYDRLGRVSEARVKNVVSQYVDGTGSVVSNTTDAITAYLYDGLGNVTQKRERVALLADSTTEVWNTTDAVYDKLGREIDRQSPGFTSYQGSTARPTVSTEYDGLGHVVRTLQRGTDNAVETDDRITRFVYDSNGNNTQRVDAEGNVTTYELDTHGRVARATVKAVKDADGATHDVPTLYQYDAAGRIVTQTDAGTGEVRRFAYNAFGQISGKSLGDGWQEFVQYNTLGKIQKSNSDGGVTKIYLYDRTGNATRMISSGTTDLTNMSISAAAQDVSLLNTFSVYDKRSQLVRTVEPDISYLRDKVSMQQAFTQQLADLYGPISVANSSGGNYVAGVGNSTGYTYTQVSGTTDVRSMPAAASAQVTGAKTLGALNTAAALPTIGTFGWTINWAGEEGYDYDGGLAGDPESMTMSTGIEDDSSLMVGDLPGEQPNITPGMTMAPGPAKNFWIPSTFPAYSYRVVSPTGTVLGTGLAPGGMVTLPAGTSSLQVQLSAGAGWIEVSKLSNVYSGPAAGAYTYHWSRNFSSTETRRLFVPLGSSASASMYTGTGAQQLVPGYWNMDVAGTMSAGFQSLDTSALAAGTYTILVQGWDANGNRASAETITVSVGDGCTVLSRGQLTKDNAILWNQDGHRYIYFDTTVIAAGSGTMYVRAKGSVNNWGAFALNRSVDVTSLGPGSYEFITSVGSTETYGEFTIDGAYNVQLANSGMLRQVSRPQPQIGFDLTGRLSATGSSYVMDLNVGGVAMTQSFTGSGVTFNLAPSMASLGASNYVNVTQGYSYRVYIMRPDGIRQFVGEGSGSVRIGSDPLTIANNNTSSYQPIAGMVVPTGVPLTGGLTVTPTSPAGGAIGIVSGDWRRSFSGTTLGVDLSQWLPASGTQTVSISYAASDAVFTGSYQLSSNGSVTCLSFTRASRQPKLDLTISGATSLSVLRVGASDASLANVSMSRVSASGSTFTWDAGDQANLGARRFYYEAVDGAGNVVSKGYGSLTVSGDGSITSTVDTPLLRPSLVRFTPPSTATSFELRVRPKGSTGAYTVYSNLATEGSARVFDATSLRPGTGSADFDCVYLARDAAGNTVSSGSGTLTLQSNGASSAALTEDRKPTIVTLQGPAGKPVSRLQLDLRTAGSAGAYTTLILTGTWDAARNCSVFTWDASSYTPALNTNAYDYVLRMQNADGSAFKNEVGDAIEIAGVMTLGGSASAPIQMKQYVTQLAQAAQVTRMQSFNAFGEVAEEYDDRTYQRALNMVAQYGGTADVSATRTTFTYNALGQLLTKADPQTHITLANGHRYRDRPVDRYGYDLLGRVATITDANGNLSRQRYDGDQLVQQWAGDGGFTKTEYDIYGSARKLTDALGAVRTQTTDKLGNVTQVQQLGLNGAGITRVENFTGTSDAVASTLTDTYQYDAFGHRIKHTNTLGWVDKTYYDSLGRVTASVSAENRRTNYVYSFIAAGTVGGILGAGGKNLGGWQLATTGADGRTSIDRNDYFSRLTWHQDLAGRSYVYGYDVGGRLTSQTSSGGQNIEYSYYANGYVKEAKDLTERTLSRYGYDNAGNRAWEAYSQLDVASDQPVGSYQDSALSYDELNRLSRVKDLSVDVQYEYDAVGNRRAVHAVYWDPATLGTRRQDDLWYTYDAANRFTTSKGAFAGPRGTSANDAAAGHITRGTDGVTLTYDAAGLRRSVTDAAGNVESYSYSADGYLEDVKVNGLLAARRRVDSLGRTLGYRDYQADGSALQYKISEYDKDNRLLTEQLTLGADANKSDYFYYTDTSDTLASASKTGAGELAKVITTQTGTSNYTTMSYRYQYWDSAKQQSIQKQAYNEAAPGWAPGLSNFSYDANGYLKRAIDFAGGRTLNYFNNATGLTLRREEVKGASTKSHYWFYAAGRTVGEVSSDPADTYRVSYAEALAQRPLPTGSTNGVSASKRWLINPDAELPAQPAQFMSRTQREFLNTRPARPGDFDQNYEPISASYPAAAATSYTVRSGDTLRTIAQSLWGDSAMWYLIAQANNLSGSETLVAGQVLVIPNKVTNIHNNASTFRPYNPGEVIGNVDPTLPAPPRPQSNDGCGGLGMVLMIVVIVVVTIYTAGAAGAAMGATTTGTGVGATMGVGTGVLTGATATGLSTGAMMGAAAIGGAVGSIAGQLVGNALGVTEGFSWKQVALSALGAGAGSGIGSALNGAAQGAQAGSLASDVLNTGWSRAAIAGAAGASVTQVMQGKWSWREVAASAVGSAAGQAAGSTVGDAMQGSDWAGMASRFASGMAAGWASDRVRAIDPNYVSARMSTMFAGSLGNALGESIASAAVSGGGSAQYDQWMSNKDARDAAEMQAMGMTVPESQRSEALYGLATASEARYVRFGDPTRNAAAAGSDEVFLSSEMEVRAQRGPIMTDAGPVSFYGGGDGPSANAAGNALGIWPADERGFFPDAGVEGSAQRRSTDPIPGTMGPRRNGPDAFSRGIAEWTAKLGEDTAGSTPWLLQQNSVVGPLNDRLTDWGVDVGRNFPRLGGGIQLGRMAIFGDGTNLDLLLAAAPFAKPEALLGKAAEERIAARLGESLPATSWVDSMEIRQSQQSISYAKKDAFGNVKYTLDDIGRGFAENPGDARLSIDAVRMRDGGLTTLDNSRPAVLNAQGGGQIQVRIRGYDDPLTSAETERFTAYRGGVERAPSTWGEAVDYRIWKQGEQFSSQYPNGAGLVPKVTGAPANSSWSQYDQYPWKR